MTRNEHAVAITPARRPPSNAHPAITARSKRIGDVGSVDLERQASNANAAVTATGGTA